MLDRAFAQTFRNYSTIFVIVAVIAFPLHLLYAFAFRDVIATNDFHAAIAALPEDRRVGGVGPAQLDQARLFFWILTGVEVALLPLVVRAARRVFAVDEAGGIPTGTDAWADAFRAHEKTRLHVGWPAVAGLGLVAAAISGLLLNAIGDAVTDFLPGDLRWVGVALTDGGARAAALPLFVGPLAAIGTKGRGPSAPKLY